MDSLPAHVKMLLLIVSLSALFFVLHVVKMPFMSTEQQQT